MSERMKEAVEKLKRDMVAELLATIAPQQRELFDRIFPGGVPTHKLDIAYDLLERTIRKNNEDPSRLVPITISR